MSGEEVKATDDTTKATNDDAEEPSPTEVAEQTPAPLSEHEESNKSTIKSESVPVNPDEPKPAAAAAATTTAAQQFDGYVCVAAGSEGAAAAAANLLEIPVENDNTLKLSTLEHSFPNAIGLKFKNEATGVFRTLAVSDDGRVILEPKGGWGTRRYVAIFRTADQQQPASSGVTVMKGLKRPLQSSAMDLNVVYGRGGGSSSQEFAHGLPPPSAAAHYHEQCGAMGQDGGDFTAAAAAASAAGSVDSGNYWRVADKGRAAGVTAAGTAAVRAQPTAPVDLVVLNIDFTTKKEALVKYFEKFGKVEFAEIKLDRITGKSKGYGFIKMSTLEEQQKVLDTGHLIDGRVIEVRIPIRTQDPEAKKTRADVLSTKIHVGRVPDDFTLQDLYKGFSEKAQEMSPHARVDRVIIPHPRRGFAFVTFNDANVTKRFIEMQDVVIGGASVAVSYPTPRKEMDDLVDFGGGGEFGGGAGGGLDSVGAAYSVAYTPGMPTAAGTAAAAGGISSGSYRQFAGAAVSPGSLAGFGGIGAGIAVDGFGSSSGGGGGLMSSTGRAGMSSPIGGGFSSGGSSGSFSGSQGGGGLLPPSSQHGGRSYGYFHHSHQQQQVAGGQHHQLLQQQQQQQSAFGSNQMGYGMGAAAAGGGGMQSQYGSSGGHLGGYLGGGGGRFGGQAAAAAGMGGGGGGGWRGGAVRSHSGGSGGMGGAGGRYAGNMLGYGGNSRSAGGGSMGSRQMMGQQGGSSGYGQPPKNLGGAAGDYGY